MQYLVLISLLILLGAFNATARSLEAIRQRGALTLCAHPNALPYASKRDVVPGFQVEIARALAQRLGVSLEQHWVINSFQYRRADCDIVLDAITDQAILAEVGLRVSRPLSSQRGHAGGRSRVHRGVAHGIGIRPARRRTGRLDGVDDAQ